MADIKNGEKRPIILALTDARQELLNRLLSGKKLTGRDEKDIRRLWQEKVDAMQESATRQREQDTIRKFTEGNKSE
ncbi:hypothetical protein HEM41_023780 [Escherichia coli]|nr:hypothetical protein [Escherichia coli]MBB8547146.1 hypothetical protein [Escherichia coli]